MQEIVNYYATMYEDTRGKVQNEKNYDAELEMENNNIVEVLINVKINEEKIKTIEVKNNLKTLKVCVSPNLTWRDEFEYVKQKIKVSIKSN